MALVLVATAGSSSANTYITLAEAESYFEARLHSSTWDDSANITKNEALVWATRLLDNYFNWVGLKVTSDQALQWPRQSVIDERGDLLDSTTIPNFLKNATAEFSMWLIASDRTADPSSKGVKRIKVDTIDITLDKIDRSKVIPDIVYQMVSFYASKKGKKTSKLIRTRGELFNTQDILTMNLPIT